jgi:four helix bundle protein
MDILSFEDLVVWQKAHQLMLAVYQFVNYLPSEEKYNRRSQLVRAGSSVPANIAEGFGRYHYQENIQFCRQARGSLYETKNHIIAAQDLNQAPQEDCARLLEQSDDVLRLLNAYLRSTHRRQQGTQGNNTKGVLQSK